MKSRELLFLCPSLGGRQRGAGSTHTPEMTQIGGCTTTHPWGHLAPAQGTLHPRQQLAPRPTLAPWDLLLCCSFEAQIYLLEMLFFRDGELTATACAQQPQGKVWGDGDGRGQGVCRETSRGWAHDGSGDILLGFWLLGGGAGRQPCLMEQSSWLCERWHLKEGMLVHKQAQEECKGGGQEDKPLRPRTEALWVSAASNPYTESHIFRFWLSPSN